MAQKRYSDQDFLKLLREVDLYQHNGMDVVSACRKAGIGRGHTDFFSPTATPEFSRLSVI